MYEPVRFHRRPTRRGVLIALVVAVAMLIAIVVTVLRTMPKPPPAKAINLDELELMMNPDSAQTELVATMVKQRIAHPEPTATASPAAAAPPPCVASSTPHPWDSTQQANAKTIVQVGMALDFPARGEVIAVATAMQESQLYNLGDLGSKNDHDSLGLFQQRPSMGWGTAAEVTDPVYAATGFYLALRRVPGWEKMALTVAAQKVQRSGFPNAYAKWETDATALVQNVQCNAL